VSVDSEPPTSLPGAGFPPRTVDLLRSVAGMGRALFGAAACSVALLNDAETQLTFVAAVGAGAEQIVGVQLPVSRGIAGWVASSGQPIRVADVQSDARFDRAVAESTGYVPRTILAVPLEGVRDDTLGVIQLLDPVASTDRDDMALLGLLSTHAEACLAMAASVPNGTDSSTVSGQSNDFEALLVELRNLRPDQRATAAQLVSTFIAYTRRS
jgi:hypothetical protein